MSKLREGDVFIFNTNEGGSIQVINGEPEMDGGMESAVYLSLFGNDGSDFWMNEYLTQSEKLTGSFIGFIIANAKTITTLNKAEEFARNDLQWFLSDGIADKINISISSISRNIINLSVEIQADGETVFEKIYQINWGFQLNNPASERIIDTIDEVEKIDTSVFDTAIFDNDVFS
jgi:phage gp46-like protein